MEIVINLLAKGKLLISVINLLTKGLILIIVMNLLTKGFKLMVNLVYLTYLTNCSLITGVHVSIFPSIQ